VSAGRFRQSRENLLSILVTSAITGDFISSRPVITIGLSNVTFIDTDGEQLLGRMAARGVQLDGSGCMNRYVMGKISGGVR